MPNRCQVFSKRRCVISESRDLKLEAKYFSPMNVFIFPDIYKEPRMNK